MEYSMIHEKNITITGSEGYVGKETKNIFSDKYNIFLVDTKINISCFNIKKINSYIKTSESVIHLSAYKNIKESLSNPIKYYFNNIISTLIMSIFCKIYSKPMVFSSSAAVYNSNNAYAKSKKIEEFIIKKMIKKYVILRYFNIGGATKQTNDDGSSNLFSVIKNNDKIVIHNSKSTRDYIHVSDIATANFLSMEYLLKNGDSIITDIFTGNRYTVDNILDIYDNLGHNIKREYDHYKEVDILPKINNHSAINWKPTYDIKDIVYSEIEFI